MIEKLLRNFRTSLAGEEFTLEDEIALYRRRAEMARREERYADSLVFLAKVLRLNPYDISVRMQVAQTYHRFLNEPAKALLTYEKVIASAGYDDSNPWCAHAREAIREIESASAATIPELPLEIADEIRAESGIS
jgi:hypothetical protein